MRMVDVSRRAERHMTAQTFLSMLYMKVYVKMPSTLYRTTFREGD